MDKIQKYEVRHKHFDCEVLCKLSRYFERVGWAASSQAGNSARKCCGSRRGRVLRSVENTAISRHSSCQLSGSTGSSTYDRVARRRAYNRALAAAAAAAGLRLIWSRVQWRQSCQRGKYKISEETSGRTRIGHADRVALSCTVTRNPPALFPSHRRAYGLRVVLCSTFKQNTVLLLYTNNWRSTSSYDSRANRRTAIGISGHPVGKSALLIALPLEVTGSTFRAVREANPQSTVHAHRPHRTAVYESYNRSFEQLFILFFSLHYSLL